MQGAPVFDRRLDGQLRMRLFAYHCIGLLLAGLGAFLAFRIFNPYTFIGPGFFDILPNDRWFDNLRSGSMGVSGLQDFPPNWQWLSRAAYFYPLKDMVLWAMGPPLALLAWTGWIWSLWRILRGRKAALANLLPVVWIGVYFVWMNQVWPMTMRYYLPLYSALAVLAAWAVYQLHRNALRAGRDQPLSRILLLVLGALFLAVGGYQIADGSVDATSVTAAGIAIGLLFFAAWPLARARRATILGAFAILFTGVWGLMFSNVYRHQTTLVQSSRYLFQRVPGDFAMRIDGADESTPLINLAIGGSRERYPGEDERLFREVTRYSPGETIVELFTAPVGGAISSIFAPHLGDPNDDPADEALTIRVFRESETVALAEARLEANLTRTDHPLGSSYDIPFREPLVVEAGVRYRVEIAIAEGSGEVIGSGSVVLTEGDWDNRVTGTLTCQLPEGLSLADRPASGLLGHDECHGKYAFSRLVNSYDQIMSFPVDDRTKYDSILYTLDIGDYLTIASNRFYDTQSRNPLRWPLTRLYYEELFAGDIGLRAGRSV